MFEPKVFQEFQPIGGVRAIMFGFLLYPSLREAAIYGIAIRAETGESCRAPHFFETPARRARLYRLHKTVFAAHEPKKRLQGDERGQYVAHKDGNSAKCFSDLTDSP